MLVVEVIVVGGVLCMLVEANVPLVKAIVLVEILQYYFPPE